MKKRINRISTMSVSMQTNVSVLPLTTTLISRIVRAEMLITPALNEFEHTGSDWMEVNKSAIEPAVLLLQDIAKAIDEDYEPDNFEGKNPKHNKCEEVMDDNDMEDNDPRLSL